ncbi:MAG: NTPase [Anaerolineae bacterium]
MGRSLLLTGHPGIGKTTVIRQVVKQLGDRAGGFYTEEIKGPGGRQGFQLITLDGKETILAHKDLRGPNVPRIGRYGVDVDALERVGVKALQRARDAGKIVIVDEIGRMELFSGKFQETLMYAFMGRSTVIGTVIKKSYPEADAFKILAQVEVWELNQRNRDEMASRILKWLKRRDR